MSAGGRRPAGRTLPSTRTREVVALLLRSFSTGDLAALCAEAGLAPEEVAHLRAAFVAAGTARVHEMLHPARWLQVNLTLDTLGGQWIELVGGEFQDRVRAWLAAGLVEHFFFVHKPPGMRLRFLGASARLTPELHEYLDSLARQRVLDAWSTGVYDPEVYQFGGEAGLEIAHAFFTIESLAVLAYHRLRLRHPTALAPDDFSLLLLDMFLRAVTADEWELWDLWRKLELTGRLPPSGGQAPGEEPAAAGELRERLLPLLRLPAITLALLTAEEQTIFDDYRAAIPAVAARLLRARDGGELLWGAREILPFWIIFHWNRMGFDLPRQRWLAALMVAALHPKGSDANRPARRPSFRPGRNEKDSEPLLTAEAPSREAPGPLSTPEIRE